MGIFSNWFERQGQPTPKTEERAFELENDTGFEMVNNSLVAIAPIKGVRAIKNSDIRKAIDTIANDVSNLPINTVISESIQEFSPFDYLLNSRPNQIQDAKTFWFAITASMLMNGNAYAEIIRDKEGNVCELQYLPIDELTVDLNEYGNKIKSYTYYGEGKQIVFSPENILHFKVSPFDGIQGVSPLYSLKTEIELAVRGNKSLLAFYNRSIKGTGKITLKSQRGAGVNKEGAKALRNRFVDLNNPNNEEALGLIIVEEGVYDYQETSMDTGFLNLINNITFEQKQIAKVFNIPLEKFGMETINSSSTELNNIYIQTGLKSYLRAIESELTFKLCDNKLMRFVFDTAEMTTPDSKTRIDSLSLAIKSTLLTPNEARKELGYAPLPGGDVLIANTAFAEKEGTEDNG